MSLRIFRKTYIIGESIDIKLKLSENVNVTGTPRLKLETGDVDSYANYISGSGNDTLLFRYIVSSGDTTSSLDYTGNDALELNGGIMTFITGTSLNRALPDPGSANSLKGTFGTPHMNIKVDGVVPKVVSVTSTFPMGPITQMTQL